MCYVNSALAYVLTSTLASDIGKFQNFKCHANFFLIYHTYPSQIKLTVTIILTRDRSTDSKLYQFFFPRAALADEFELYSCLISKHSFTRYWYQPLS